MSKLDEYLKQVRENLAEASPDEGSESEAVVNAVPKLLAIIEAQRAELDRLFTMAQTGKTYAGIAGNAAIEARFEKSEI